MESFMKGFLEALGTENIIQAKINIILLFFCALEFVQFIVTLVYAELILRSRYRSTSEDYLEKREELAKLIQKEKFAAVKYLCISFCFLGLARSTPIAYSILMVFSSVWAIIAGVLVIWAIYIKFFKMTKYEKILESKEAIINTDKKDAQKELDRLKKSCTVACAAVVLLVIEMIAVYSRMEGSSNAMNYYYTHVYEPMTDKSVVFEYILPEPK